MQPKTLELAPTEKVIEFRDVLMGYSAQKNSNYVKVFDNWVNRLALEYPLRMRKTPYTVTTERQKTTMNVLYPFQVYDVEQMVSYGYFLNRNKMGSGKTIEAIAACILLSAQSILIVCPKTLQTQWASKLTEWWPERTDDIKTYEFGYEPTRHDILIVNPEKIVSKKSAGKFDAFTWDVICVDEAHMIKNRDSKRTIAIKNIPAKHKYAMTGTPLLKSPDDLYSIFDFLNPEIAGTSYWRFTEYVCNIREDFYGRHITGLTHDEKHVAILKQILEHVSCYNEIEVGNGKEVIHVPLTMDAKQHKLYKQLLRVELENLPANITIPNGAVKATRLLQTTSCPKVFYDPAHSKDSDYSWGVKFEWTNELLESNPDLKIVVYSKYATVVNAFRDYLSDKRIGTCAYTGQQSLEVRNANKEAFIHNKNIRVLAGTIDALGTGVDGLQQVCHVCVFIDRDVRPTINEQCEDRLRRTGQPEKVLCYYLECEKSIDKHIEKLNAIRSDDLRKLMEDTV